MFHWRVSRSPLLTAFRVPVDPAVVSSRKPCLCGSQKRGEEAIARRVGRTAFATQSRIGGSPRRLQNRGVESPQSKGDPPWKFRQPTLRSPTSSGLAMRSPSCPCISMRRPPACWTSSATSTPAPAGTLAFAPAPSGCRGALASTSAQPARRSAWRVRFPRCRASPRRSRAASSPTPRSAPSPAWRRPRPKSGCWPSGAPAPPSTSSASSAAGDGWIARRSGTRPPGSTPIAPFTCIPPKTAP